MGPEGSQPASVLRAERETAGLELGLEESGHPGLAPLENSGHRVTQSPAGRGPEVPQRQNSNILCFFHHPQGLPSRPHGQDTVLPLYGLTRLVRLGVRQTRHAVCLIKELLTLPSPLLRRETNADRRTGGQAGRRLSSSAPDVLLKPGQGRELC